MLDARAWLLTVPHASYVHLDFQRDNQEPSLTIQRKRPGSVESLFRKAKISPPLSPMMAVKISFQPWYIRISSLSVFIRGHKTWDEPIIIQGQAPHCMPRPFYSPHHAWRWTTTLTIVIFENDDSFLASLDFCPREDSSELPGNKAIGIIGG